MRRAAALEEILGLHQPTPVKWTDVCSAHMAFGSVEEEEACPDCQVIAYTACARCRNTEDEPARIEDCEVRAILARTADGDSDTSFTKPQIAALQALGRHRYLSRGQDGITSTAVIRRLQAMGLVMVNPHTPQPGGWTAALTENGRQKLAEIDRQEQP